MDENKKLELYQRAIQKWGMELQLDMVIEECSELTKEICKFKRDRNNREQIVEELSDVLNMIEQLKLMFDIDDSEIQTYMDAKLLRLEEKLNME